MLISDVIFEDSRLRQCVLDAAESQNITRTGELSILKEECSGKGFTSLVGMEKFTNLIIANFSNSDIPNLEPLSNLNKLLRLVVNNTSIRDLNALDQLKELIRIEAQNNVLLEDVSAVLNMEFVKFLRLAGSGTALFKEGINCDILDQLEADILGRKIGDLTTPPEFERPVNCDNTPTLGFNGQPPPAY